MSDTLFYALVAAGIFVVGVYFGKADWRSRERLVRQELQDRYMVAVAKASLWDRIYIKDEQHLNNFCLEHAPGGPLEKLTTEWYDFKRDAREHWPAGSPQQPKKRAE